MAGLVGGGRRRAGVRAALAVVAMLGGFVGPATDALARGGVVELPLAFDVRNTNTSGLPCGSDGAAYAVRGHLVAPAEAHVTAADRAVTLYVHGFNLGEVNWRLKAVPGYDYAAELARLGHTSVTIDRLGYNASDHPEGFATCIGSQADVTHQLVQQLRHGAYTVDGGRPVRFSTVVLAGHDSGGEIVEVEAYSYRDIDGLMVMDYADTGFTPTVTGWSAQASLVCARGGEPARPGGPGGYFHLGPSDHEVAALAFPNADPAVVAAMIPQRRRNPCGELASVPAGAATNPARLSRVRAPVLIVAGDRDVGFSEDGVRRQRGFFTGSDDVSVEIIANTGHFPMFERTAPVFRDVISRWLHTRRFATTPARGSRVQIARGSIRATRRGVVRVRLACAGDLACAGVLTLQTARRVRLRRSHTPARRIKLGARAFRIQAGSQTVVAVRLSRRARRLVRRQRALNVSATARMPSADGPAAVTTATLRLTAR